VAERDKKELLAELLLRWEELYDRGQDTPASELAKDHPELIQQLERRIKALKEIAWLDKPLDDDPLGDDPPSEPKPATRTLANRYRLDELIAEGGFAQVYRAYDTELQRTVAIKIPKPSKLESKDAFLAEARRVARLKHESIVPVHDVGVEGDTCFIVTEYVEGGSLADKLVSGRIPREQAIRCVAEISDALDYAHLNGVIHRDIKPANILIDHHGRAKLADFGIAHSATKTGDFAPSLGTLSYMSPEVLQGKPSDHRSDLYSLGVVLYEVLTGRIPYSSSEPNVLRKEIVLGKPSDWPNDFPKDIRDICQKALSKSPHQRHASAAQFGAELRRVESGRRGGIVWPWIAVLVAIPVIASSFLLINRLPAPPTPNAPVSSALVDEDAQYADRPANPADDFQYEIVGDTVKITRFIGSATVVKIPDTIEDKPVTIIGRKSFSQSRDFTAVILPKTTTTIESEAFFNCSWLRHITIPEHCTRIEEGAFAGTALTEVFLPASVTHFSNAAYQCPSLVSIRVDPANQVFKSIDGILYDKQVTAVLRCPEGRTKAVSLPSTVHHVGRMAFHHCLNLSSITLPDGVDFIGQMAFYRCTNLERISIPVGVKKIEAQTFVDCPSLKSISLPEGLEEIDDGVFWGCTSLKTIMIPASVTKIHEKAFDNCPAEIIYEKPRP
jgi:serine/threonine protein kinase